MGHKTHEKSDYKCVSRDLRNVIKNAGEIEKIKLLVKYLKLGDVYWWEAVKLYILYKAQYGREVELTEKLFVTIGQRFLRMYGGLGLRNTKIGAALRTEIDAFLSQQFARAMPNDVRMQMETFMDNKKFTNIEVRVPMLYRAQAMLTAFQDQLRGFPQEFSVDIHEITPFCFEAGKENDA